jgi:ribose transport system permease protein/putative xylitol transport system permease protein
LLSGVAAGVLNGLLFAYLRLPSFLVTLGTSLMITGVGLILTGGASIQIFNQDFLNISQAKLVPQVPNIALWSLLIYGIAVAVGIWTRFGRYAYAIGGGEVVARLSGVPVQRFKFYAFVISATLAGFAGVLLTARLGSGSPGYTAASGDIVLLSIAAVVMGGTALTGGVGGVQRTILGVLVLTILENGLTGMNVHPFKQAIIEGCVVILAVALTIDRSKLSAVK